MKAILMFDKMPNSCDECEVRCGGYTAKDYAEKGIKRPSWCPLKPMPNKKPVSYHDDLFGDVEKNLTNIGWNDCIDEIEKEPYGGYKTTGVESIKPIE